VLRRCVRKHRRGALAGVLGYGGFERRRSRSRFGYVSPDIARAVSVKGDRYWSLSSRRRANEDKIPWPTYGQAWLDDWLIYDETDRVKRVLS
jgi:hypothetical protein